jgi:hypothetical protein
VSERSDPEPIESAASDAASTESPSSEAAPGRLPKDEAPVLPRVSGDERDLGWGDDDGRRDADWYRRERPPHHE